MLSHLKSFNIERLVDNVGSYKIDSFYINGWTRASGNIQSNHGLLAMVSKSLRLYKAGPDH